MGKVLTNARWHANQASLEALVAKGAVVIRVNPLEGVDLPAVAATEEVVGELTESEARILRAIYDLKVDLELFDRSMQDNVKAKFDALMTDAAAEGQTPFLLVDPYALAPSLSEAEKQHCFGMSQTASYLHAMLHWKLGERLGLHHWRLGVRAGSKVVKVQTRRMAD